jgi:hypothetical protein
MIRLLGFLIGSATSIGLILLILGVPEFNLTKDLISEQSIESVPAVIEDAKTGLDVVANDVVEEMKLPEQTIADNEAEKPAEESIPVEYQGPDIIELPEEPEQHIAEFENGPAEPDIKWHAFWNPFRSRIAAEGFVGQLEKVTGLDYRVVKIKTGVYEVTFAYESDEERRNKMELIASATGLDLPDS